MTTPSSHMVLRPLCVDVVIRRIEFMVVAVLVYQRCRQR
jgi:hypothetical protein